MLMFDDEREISHVNCDAKRWAIAVGSDSVTKIEVYKEHGSGDFIPFIKVWHGDFLAYRTPALDKEIVYKKP